MFWTPRTALGRLHDACLDVDAATVAADEVRAALTIDDPRRPQTPVVVPMTEEEAQVLARTWQDLADLAADLAGRAARVADACAATAAHRSR